MSGKENEAYRLEKERKVQASRKFEEITSLELLNKNCIDKQKGCGIAFLPALTIVYLSIFKRLQIDYERENFNQHIKILEELEKDAKTKPMYYMWINATCHVP